MKLNGTKTEENMMTAFQGESCARSKYICYAEQARKENRLDVAELFEKMAVNETAHARIWFRYLNDIGASEQNLHEAMEGEKSESQEMYPEFAAQARKDGFTEIADMFERVAEIEHQHEERFRREIMKLLSEGSSQSFEEKPTQSYFVCDQCGDQIPATKGEPPYACRVCGALGTMSRQMK